MKDIAAAAGVSRAAVSIAFRGAPGVSEATRKRILEVADDLGYIRDESARVLRSDAGTAIGVTFRTNQPFQLEVLDGLYAAVDESVNQILLSGISERRSEDDAVASLLAHRAAVLALVSPTMSERALADLSRKTPVVSIGRQIRSKEVTWVASDDQGGMSAALSHLLALGHHDIVYLSSVEAPAGRDRLRALRKAVEIVGAGSVIRLEDGGWSEESGAAAAEKMLSSGRLPTAIIGFNDRCALGVLDVFLRQGIEVPHSVSVIGFDDTAVASRHPVNMTSIHQDRTEMARLGAARALALLKSSSASVPQATLVPTSLTIRATTGPVRKG